MYQWIPVTDNAAREKFDTELVENWT